MIVNYNCCYIDPYICTQQNVGFGLGWDTQIPRIPNQNKTQKSQSQVKVFVMFGLGLWLLGVVSIGISWDLGVPVQSKSHVFFVGSNAWMAYIFQEYNIICIFQ